MEKERMPSEIISDFINLCKQSHDNFNSAKQMVEQMNSRTYEWTHKLEDAKDKSERNKLATAWRNELLERRKQRDKQALWKSLHEFSISEQNKPTLKRLESVLKNQIKTEEYLRIPPYQREYKGE